MINHYRNADKTTFIKGKRFYHNNKVLTGSFQNKSMLQEQKKSVMTNTRQLTGQKRIIKYD